MHNKRIENLQAIFFSQKIEAFLVTNFYNILYLTGLKTLSPHEREAFVLVTKKNVYVFTDGRYFNNFQLSISNTQQKLKAPIIILLSSEKGLMKQLQEVIEEEQLKIIGFEGEDMRFSEYFLLRKALQVKFIPFDHEVLKQRAVKTDDEIVKIKKACEIGDRCLTEVAPCIVPGITEKEVAWNIEKWLRVAGYELSFDPIVAIDANAAIPHYDTKSGDGRIKTNSVVLIDFGVKYQDYCSDITRMFFLSDAPGEIRSAYEILKKAQIATIKQIIIAKKLSEVDLYCRKLITDNSSTEFRASQQSTYPHSTGHGVGLEVHEYPKVSANSSDIICANQVFTIEPGIYMPGKWGMRIEDTITVNEKNNIEVLTKFPKVSLG